MNKAELDIFTVCYQGAKNKDAAEKFYNAHKQNRYEKMKQNKKDDYFKKLRHDERKYGDVDDFDMKR